MLYSLVQIFTMPMVLADMSMRDVANWNILLPIGVLLSTITTLGMDSAIVRFVVGQEEERRKSIYSTGVIFVICVACLLCMALWFFSSQLLYIIKLPPDIIKSTHILLCGIPGIILSQFSQQWLKYSFQRLKFISIVSLQSATYLSAITFFKLTHQIDLINVMTASLASIWLSAFFGLYYSRGMLSLNIDLNVLIKMLLYGAPMMILGFGYNLIFSIDKFLLVSNVSEGDFAIYSQAFRIAAIFSMVVSSFNFAFGPFSLALMHKDNATDTLASLRTVYLLVTCFIGLIFISFDKVILEIFAGVKYIHGHVFVPLFVFGYILYGLYSFAQIGLIFSKKSGPGLYALAISLITTITLDLLLIPNIREYGAAIGFLVGNFIMVFLSYHVAGRFYSVKSNTWKDSLLFLACLALGSASWLSIDVSSFFAEAIWKAALCTMLFGLSLCTPPFKVERVMFRNLWNKLA